MSRIRKESVHQITPSPFESTHRSPHITMNRKKQLVQPEVMIASTMNPVQRASRIAKVNSIGPPCREKSDLDILRRTSVKCHHEP